MRISPKVLLSMLLLVSVVPLFFVPKVNSQQYTTITTSETITSYATSTIGTATSTVTKTVNFQGVPHGYDGSTFTLNGTGSYQEAYCGVYNYFNFSATKSQHIIGTVESTNWVVFMLFSDSQFNKWVSGNVCATTSDIIIGHGVLSKEPIDWVVPSDDAYHFTFLNKNKAAVTIHFSVSIVSPTTVPIAVTKTFTGTAAVTQTQSQASQSQPTVPQLPSWVTGNPLELVLVVGIIIILGAVVVLRKRASEHTAAKAKSIVKAEATKKPRVAKKAEKEIQFCINCGAELPLHDKFCNKCGAAQT